MLDSFIPPLYRNTLYVDMFSSPRNYLDLSYDVYYCVDEWLEDLLKSKNTNKLKRNIGTADFVKQTGRDKYWKLREKERNQITNQKTGEIFPKLLGKVNCAICKNNKTKTLFRDKGFNFVQCEVCDLIYTNPRLIEEKAEELYRGQQSIDIWTEVLTSPIQKEYDKKKFAMRLETIEQYIEKGKILDIGCSIGHFLKIAEDRGWEPYGLELNKKAAKYARDKFKLKNIHEKMLEDAKFPKDYFSAAGLWGVLEHVLHPDRVLEDLYKVLKPGGVVVISIPNAGSLVARILREETSCFDGVVHLWFYTQKTLTKLLEKKGYKILNISSEQPEFDTVWNYINYKDPYNETAEFEYGDKTKELIEDFILKSNLGYKLIVLAQKPKE